MDVLILCSCVLVGRRTHCSHRWVLPFTTHTTHAFGSFYPSLFFSVPHIPPVFVGWVVTFYLCSWVVHSMPTHPRIPVLTCAHTYVQTPSPLPAVPLPHPFYHPNCLPSYTACRSALLPSGRWFVVRYVALISDVGGYTPRNWAGPPLSLSLFSHCTGSVWSRCVPAHTTGASRSGLFCLLRDTFCCMFDLLYLPLSATMLPACLHKAGSVQIGWWVTGPAVLLRFL